MKNMIRLFFLLIALFGLRASLTAAEPALAPRTKPMVVVLRADWCQVCKELEPRMAPLVGKYADRLEFVVLDITSDESKAQSAAKAKALGLGDFFASNVDQGTPCVVIISPRGKEMFHQVGASDPALYEQAFAKATSTSLFARCHRWMTGS